MEISEVEKKMGAEFGSGEKRKTEGVRKDGPNGARSLKPEMVPKKGLSNI